MLLTIQTVRQVSGRLLSGRIEIGDEIVVSPINQRAIIFGVDGTNDNLTLHFDRDVQVSPNCLISHVHSMPIETDVFLVEIDENPSVALKEDHELEAEFVFGLAKVTMQSLKLINEGEPVGNAVFRAPRLLALDLFDQNPETGTVRLLDNGVEVAKGRVSMDGYADQRALVTARATNITRVDHRVTSQHRTERYKHQGAVIWLTGLSGSGKSTLAVELEKELFNRDRLAYVLDGDNIRHGLNANLGFSPEDRSENIRRVGEVAALFSRAGFITISAFISPYRSDRARARTAAGEGFHEVYVSADLSVCEQRDPKGLYKRARAGEIPDFTGISAPYEPPESAELVIDTENLGIEECVKMMAEYVERVTMPDHE